ncbi:hypothetical protein GS597_04720 [Synechococcales cyanobacterium C]|uniref:SWIM-type domain-containing protein n=1 Tax=Petrachloros mirabilis ULC683 TaxID=2781853 RepID=A0A8K1ZVT9_9CYAN|nr:SWIM zinc finger family protein [Petrachloros mirabilis]NCJ05823.1 hypothetical protein [Petrachloros mirabilis ULC683]
MSQMTRTWWGQKFLEAMEDLTDAGRLSRGRSYARGSKIKSFDIHHTQIIAQVRGSVNPYFGVYKEPLYITTIDFTPLSEAQWQQAIQTIASKASLISRLMLKEIPDSLDSTLAPLGLNLLPHSRKDFSTQCSCPDWSNPCKHIAGVFYRLAANLDEDPFLLFELRGLSRQQLLQELAKSPLGQALSTELQQEERPPQAVASYYTPPQTQPAQTLNSLRDFWQGDKRLPQTLDPIAGIPVSGIMVKQQGDFPAFWHRNNSFLEVMETLYEQVRRKGSL